MNQAFFPGYEEQKALMLTGVMSEIKIVMFLGLKAYMRSKKIFKM